MTSRTVLKRHIAAVVLALVCSAHVAGIAQELPPASARTIGPASTPRRCSSGFATRFSNACPVSLKRLTT